MHLKYTCIPFKAPLRRQATALSPSLSSSLAHISIGPQKHPNLPLLAIAVGGEPPSPVVCVRSSASKLGSRKDSRLHSIPREKVKGKRSSWQYLHGWWSCLPCSSHLWPSVRFEAIHLYFKSKFSLNNVIFTPDYSLAVPFLSLATCFCLRRHLR